MKFLTIQKPFHDGIRVMINIGGMLWDHVSHVDSNSMNEEKLTYKHPLSLPSISP